MKTLTITLWLISLVLALAVEGQVPVDELSTLQSKALSLALEDYHRKDYIKSGFKMSTLLEATQTDYSSGIFVNLHFTAKQTSCKKDNWNHKDCTVNKTGRTSNCFACFKFEYGSHKVLSQLIDCIAERHLKTERDGKRRESCKHVQRFNEQGLALPGSFGFVKSQ